MKRAAAVLLALGIAGVPYLHSILRPGPKPGIRLLHANTCTPSRPLRPATPPARGTDVEELQERLAELGLYHGPVHGVYDAGTVKAVRDLQLSRGTTPTGEVTNLTWWQMAATGAGRRASRPMGRPKGTVGIVIDVDRHTLTVLVDGRPYKQYGVATGRPGHPSPPGDWRIVEKAFESGGDFGSRWLGLDVPWGGYGIHGTNRPWSIGRQASLGCFRMHNHDVEELFEWVDVGTPVTVRGWAPEELNGRFGQGSVGPDVVSLQLGLRQAGFAEVGRADGRFGPVTAAAVRDLQTFFGLPADGVADADELLLIGRRKPPLKGRGDGR